MNKKHLAVILLVCAVGASVAAPAFAPQTADPASRLAAWIEQLPLDDRVVAQISRYSEEKDDLGAEYPERTAAAMRSLVLNDVKRALSGLSAGGDTVVEAEFMEAGFMDPEGREPDDKHARQFEEGFIRTEATAFIGIEGVTPERALKIYASAEFRMDVSSRIKRIYDDGGSSCIEVKGVKALLSPVFYCNDVVELVEPGLASEHSQVVSNPGDGDYQTVYFKESVKTFVAVPGGLAYHYINYIRAVKLGSIKKSFGRGKIEDSEKDKLKELQRRLSDGS